MTIEEDEAKGLWSRLRVLLGVRDSHHGMSNVDASGIAIPPARLRYDVAGTNDLEWFLEGGRLGAETLVSTLAKQGLELESFNSVLDFGCGCGRVLRHLSDYSDAQLHGTDISRKGIAWADRHLNFAEFGTNKLNPPTRYRQDSFDFIYAFSVFTHLSHDLQKAWMSELHRILKPKGYLLLSVHGEHYRDRIPDELLEKFDKGKLVVTGVRQNGSNHCAAFHPEPYVRQHMACEMGFEILQHTPRGALGNPEQDIYLLQSG